MHVRIEDNLPYFHSFPTRKMLDSALKQMMLFAKLVEIAPLASNKKLKCQRKKTTKNTDGSHQ